MKTRHEEHIVRPTRLRLHLAVAGVSMQAAGAATGGAKTGADTVKEAGGRFAAFLDVAGKVVVATGKGLITGLPLGPPGAVIAGIQAGVSEASKHSEAFQRALFDQMIADSDSSDEEEERLHQLGLQGK